LNVILLGNYPHDGHESMVRYAEMLKTLLAANGHHAEIIRPEPFFGRLKPSGHGLGKWLGYLDKYVLFPFFLRGHIRRQKRAIRTGGTLLVHICDQANAVYTQWLQDIPHLLTCHDVMAIQVARGMVPGLKTGWTGRLFQGWILSGIRRAAHIVCVSQETRADLLALAPELDARTRTLESPLNYPYAPMPVAEATAQLSSLRLEAHFQPGKDRFLFHVGGNQWYKNREGLIKIYAALLANYPDWIQEHPLKLVMAGKSPTEAMLQLVEELGLTGKAVFVTSVSNQQLCAFYSLAELLVYPSLKEGFGWPLIEAQACGCPVVTADRSPMCRLAGPAALLADPQDPTAFAACIFQVLSEAPPTGQMRKSRALQHAENFSPGTFAKELTLIYGDVGGGIERSS